MGYFLAYCLVMSENFKNVASTLLVMMGLAFIFVILIYIFLRSDPPSNDEDFNKAEKDFHRLMKWMLTIMLILLPFVVLLPTNEQILKIIALQYISSSEEARKLPDNVLKLLNTSTKELEDLISKEDRSQK
jgi:hypothetical protein